MRRAAQELAALRRAATLELQQLQAATGVTIGSCSACRLPMSEASGGGSSGPAASPLEVVRAPVAVPATANPILAAISTPRLPPKAAAGGAPAAAAAAAPLPPSPRRMQAVRGVAAVRAAPPSGPAVPAAPAGTADAKLADGELDAAEAGAPSDSDDEAEVWHDCGSTLSRCSTPSRGQARRRRGRGRGKGAPAGRACCTIM